MNFVHRFLVGGAVGLLAFALHAAQPPGRAASKAARTCEDDMVSARRLRRWPLLEHLKAAEDYPGAAKCMTETGGKAGLRFGC